MATSKVEEAVKYFVNSLVKRLGPKVVKVVLFGGYAKGYADERSDLDLLVVYAGGDGEVLDATADTALDTSLKFNIPVEPVVMSAYEYEQETLFTLEVKKREGLFTR